jgi:hypothetical protein
MDNVTQVTPEEFRIMKLFHTDLSGERGAGMGEDKNLARFKVIVKLKEDIFQHEKSHINISTYYNISQS